MKTPAFIPFLCSIAFALPAKIMAQHNDPRFLSKYSYPIFTVIGKEQHTGTAFFYQSGDSSFLVSNYHAIKGMNPLQQKIAFKTDTLYLKYPVKDSAEWKLISLNISEEITGKTKIFSMFDRIDLLKIPFEIPQDADIHFINDLIDPDYIDKEPEEVVVFGYPVNPGSIPAFYAHQQRLDGKVNPNGFTDYDASMRVNFPGVSEGARAIVSRTSRYYYFIKPYAAQGYSGSPVFGRFTTPANEIVYRFIGVIFAGQPATKQTWAIKGGVALDYLQNTF